MSDSINPDRSWITQKYGGTSLGKFPIAIANIIEYDGFSLYVFLGADPSPDQV
jgi:hypothetical protein